MPQRDRLTCTLTHNKESFIPPNVSISHLSSHVYLPPPSKPPAVLSAGSSSPRGRRSSLILIPSTVRECWTAPPSERCKSAGVEAEDFKREGDETALWWVPPACSWPPRFVQRWREESKRSQGCFDFAAAAASLVFWLAGCWRCFNLRLRCGRSSLDSERNQRPSLSLDQEKKPEKFPRDLEALSKFFFFCELVSKH